jgi:hypothetical protein
MLEEVGCSRAAVNRRKRLAPVMSKGGGRRQEEQMTT